MKKELLALLDKRRALKAEADAINAAADKAENGELTAAQAARLMAIHGESDTVASSMEALAAGMPDAPVDPQAAITEAVGTAVAAAITATREADANVAAACVLAGQAPKASGLIKDGKPLAEVVALLQAGKVEGAGRELRTHGVQGVNDGSAWDKTIERVNARVGVK